MNGVQQVFFVVGVFVSIVGAVAFCGLLAWQGLEWWIKFNDLRGPLFKFYEDSLRKKHALSEGEER